MSAKLGNVGFLYKHILVIVLLLMLRAFDELVADIRVGTDWLLVTTHFIIHIVLWTALLPNSAAMMLVFFVRVPQKSRCIEVMHEKASGKLFGEPLRSECAV